VSIFRNLMRALPAWRSAFEAGEVAEVITDAQGREWSLWDVQRFYDSREALVFDPTRKEGEVWQPRLPRQMSRAICLFLFHNLKESEAAVQMGCAPTSPVGMYATIGLTRLIRMAQAGEIPGCRFDLDPVLRAVPAVPVVAEAPREVLLVA
jgi:hypothetical protein